VSVVSSDSMIEVLNIMQQTDARVALVARNRRSNEFKDIVGVITSSTIPRGRLESMARLSECGSISGSNVRTRPPQATGAKPKCHSCKRNDPGNVCGRQTPKREEAIADGTTTQKR